MRLGKNITNPLVIKRFKTLEADFIKAHGKTYIYIFSTYRGIESKMKMLCRKHGFFYQIPYSHKKGIGCKDCGTKQSASKRTTTLKEFIKQARKIHGDKYCYKKVKYVKTHVDVKIFCNTCKVHFNQTPHNHLDGKGCVTCGYQTMKLKQRKPRETVIKQIKAVHGNLFCFKEMNYIGGRTPLKLFCSSCKEYTYPVLSNLIKGHGCFRCYIEDKTSNQERDLRDFITNDLKIEIIKNDRTIINPKEIDIVLPSHKLAIEYNGIYWHSDQVKDQKYHLIKSQLTNKQGYNLFHIWEDQWIHPQKNLILKSMLRAKLNKITNKIYGRKTVAKQLAKTPVNFYNDNHLQGMVMGKYHYGLFHKEPLASELLAVMSFNLNHELLRFCTKRDTQILGGFNKLLKHHIKLYQPKIIDSYSDNDYSDGSIYRNNGFTNIKELKQDYFYIDKDMRRHHKFSQRKAKIIKKHNFTMDIKDTTEKELTAMINMTRCYNSGKIKWRLEPTS